MRLSPLSPHPLRSFSPYGFSHIHLYCIKNGSPEVGIVSNNSMQQTTKARHLTNNYAERPLCPPLTSYFLGAYKNFGIRHKNARCRKGDTIQHIIRRSMYEAQGSRLINHYPWSKRGLRTARSRGVIIACPGGFEGRAPMLIHES